MTTAHITCTLNRCNALLDGLESGQNTIWAPKGTRRLIRISRMVARFVMPPAYVQGEIARAHEILGRAHRIANSRR